VQKLKLLTVVLIGFLLVSSPAVSDEFVRNVYPVTPPSAFTLYAFDPDLLGAWSSVLYEFEQNFIPEKYRSLPNLGGWYGQGFVPDREMVIASGLKKAFVLENKFFDRFKIEGILNEMGLELLSAPDSIESLPLCFRTMGRIFNRPKRGEELALYAEKVLDSIQKFNVLVRNRKYRVYLAMDADGLGTACAGEYRGAFIEYAGGLNVMACQDGVKPGRPRISFEELITLDPDVILVENQALKEFVSRDSRWQNLRATREGRLYWLPRGPFSWDGHPTLTALMGMQYLANRLYPEDYHLDLETETRKFSRLFFRLELDDKMLNYMLNLGPTDDRTPSSSRP
jgi:iron complex transport system substrate-binding protein